MASSPTADNLGGRFVSIDLAADALVLLIGISASGKSTFATRHFRPTEILSSDTLRSLVSDDPGDQQATDEAFELLHRLLDMRLRRGRLTVVDATNVQDWARAPLIATSRRHRREVVAIILDVPIAVANERNRARSGRRPPPAALRRQHRWLVDSLPSLPDEGVAAVHHLRSVEAVDGTVVNRP